MLSDMLRSQTYLGKLKYNDHWHDGQHPPLITPEAFAQVQAVFANNSQAKRHPAQRRGDKAALEVLLAGMLRCTCNHALTFHRKAPERTQTTRYICNFKRKTRGIACQMPGVNGKAVEKVAFDLLVRGLRVRQAEIKAALPLVREAGATTDLEREFVDLGRKRNRILESFEDGAYGDGVEARAMRDAKLAPVLRRANRVLKMRSVVDVISA